MKGLVRSGALNRQGLAFHLAGVAHLGEPRSLSDELVVAPGDLSPLFLGWERVDIGVQHGVDLGALFLRGGEQRTAHRCDLTRLRRVDALPARRVEELHARLLDSPARELRQNGEVGLPLKLLRLRIDCRGRHDASEHSDRPTHHRSVAARQSLV